VRAAGQPRYGAQRSSTKSVTFNVNSAAARGIAASTPATGRLKVREIVHGAGQPRDGAQRNPTNSLTFNLNSAAARGITGIDSPPGGSR